MQQETEGAITRLRSLDPEWGSRRLAIVLGSGWGSVAEALMEIEGSVSYGDLPGFPVSTVEGHAGKFTWGKIGGIPVYCMQGRFHYYEGYSMQELTFPVRLFADLGIRGLLLTNAAGGITEGMQPGSLMLIEDHINFIPEHPLRGPNDDACGPRFPDMTEAWDGALRAGFKDAAAAAGIELLSGVYLAVSGPSFETPAEIRAFARLGADAVGMSTVPECLVARHRGMRVAGISCITNLAAHLGGDPLTHEEVALAAKQAQEQIGQLFLTAIPGLHTELGE